MNKNEIEKLSDDEMAEYLFDYTERYYAIIVKSAVKNFCSDWKIPNDCEEELTELWIRYLASFGLVCFQDAFNSINSN